jgi:hypothetical protein
MCHTRRLVKIGYYRKRFFVIDYLSGKLWANEFFNSVDGDDGVKNFISDNGLELITEKIFDVESLQEVKL